MFNSGFRSLPKFEFKWSGIQQRGAIVLGSMSFEALSCKGGASICICTSKVLILRVLVWHLLGSTTVVLLPCILTRGGIRLPIDSHISILFLQLKEPRVSYRPIKCQSRSWPSRVTAVSGSRKGESTYLNRQGFNT